MTLKTMYPPQANSPATYLTEAVAADATSIKVNSASVLPDLPTLLVLGSEEKVAECVLATSKSSNTITVERAVEGTAKAWPAGTSVARLFTAEDLKAVQDNILELESATTELELNAECFGNKNFLLQYKATGRTSYGITYTVNNDHSITAIGTSTGDSSCTILLSKTSLPDWLTPGKTYHARILGALAVRLQVWEYYEGSASGTLVKNVRPGNVVDFALSSTAVGVHFRIYAPSGTVANETVLPSISEALTPNELKTLICDIDTTLTQEGDAADAKAVGDAIDSLGDAIAFEKKNAEVFDVNDYMLSHVPVGEDGTSYGVTYTINDDNTITAVGTSTNGASNCRVYFDKTHLPEWWTQGQTYYARLLGAVGARLQFWAYSEGDESGTLIARVKADEVIAVKLSDDVVGLNIRVEVPSGITVNETVRASISKAPGLGELNSRVSALEEHADSPTMSLKVLCLGNSYTQDSMTFMPYILAGIDANVKLTLGLSYYSGETLAGYLAAFDNEYAKYEYDKKNPSAQAWAKLSNSDSNMINGKTVQQILADEDWDIITLQQGSVKQCDWSSFEPNLRPLINKIVGYMRETHGKSVRIGWLSPQLRWTGEQYYFPAGSTVPATVPEQRADRFEAQQACIQKVLDTTAIDFVIPCGTSVENARLTSLSEVGANGMLTASDGNGHLQEGLPCLVSSYVSALKILELLGIGYKGILGEGTRPDSDWYTGKSIPGQNGSPVGVTEYNCLLAQKCAIAAMKKPYELTEGIEDTEV